MAFFIAGVCRVLLSANGGSGGCGGGEGWEKKIPRDRRYRSKVDAEAKGDTGELQHLFLYVEIRLGINILSVFLLFQFCAVFRSFQKQN